MLAYFLRVKEEIIDALYRRRLSGINCLHHAIQVNRCTGPAQFNQQQKTRASCRKSGSWGFSEHRETEYWCRLPESNWRPFHYE